MSSGACIVTRKVTGQVSVSPSRCAAPTETTSTLCTSAAAVSSAAKSPAYRLDPTVAVMGRPVSSAVAAPASLPVRRPARPVRVGIVGEYFTAADPASNLDLERKLLAMGVEVHRSLNMTNRNLRYNEKNLRASIADYVTYDMGPTSSLTIASALRYAQEGFDGVVHVKSSGCTPEVDCVPVLQRIGRDTGMPLLYLSYDSQTSDTGLDTRLEAFYDMLAMKKENMR